MSYFFLWVVLPVGGVCLITWAALRFVPGLGESRFAAGLRELHERWTGWRDRPRGPGPRGTGTQPPEHPEAIPVTAPQPVPEDAPKLPPPPAELSPATAGAPPGAASAGGAQSDLLYAINALAAEASHGDIKAVRRVAATFAAATGELGGALSRLGTRLAEPDKDYDPVIWEPFMSAGAQSRCAAIQLGEADAMLVSLLGTTVQELADSPRRAPHSSQLNGGA